MEILKKIAKLIDVKSIITLLLTCVVAYKGEMDIQEIYLMIIAFYFGTQVEKKKEE